MNLLTLIFGGLGLVVLQRNYAFAIYAMICCCVFAAAAVFELPGGQTILVANFLLLFFGLRVLMKCGPGPVLAAYRPLGAGFFLLLFACYCVFSVVVLLPAFEGRVTVFALAQVNGTMSYVLQPLYRTGTNFSQLIYNIGNLAAFGFGFAVFRLRGAYTTVARALLLLAGLNILFGLADLATWVTHTPDALKFIKNGNFTYLDTAELNGIKRISGSFSEASGFAGFTLRLFAISFSFWLERYASRISGAIAGISLVLLAISTSTTAYIGLAGALAITLGPNFIRPLAHGLPVKRLPALATLAAVSSVSLFCLVVLKPSVFKPVQELFDSVLFHKLDSDSGVERGSWNAQAFRVFLDTGGLGAGVGSTRTSSSVMALLSNVGLPGALFYGMFAFRALSARYRDTLSREDRLIVKACRNGLLSAIFAQLFTAGTIDIGILNSILFGVSASVAAPALLWRPRQSPVPTPAEPTSPPEALAGAGVATETRYPRSEQPFVF